MLLEKYLHLAGVKKNIIELITQYILIIIYISILQEHHIQWLSLGPKREKAK